MKIIKESDQNSIDIACDFLKKGKIISFATDTVYGIACDAANEKAVENLYKVKQRNLKKPIAIFVKNLEIAKKIFNFDELSNKIAKRFFPGKLTMVLKTQDISEMFLAKNLNQNQDNFLGFRIANSDFVTMLLEKFTGILAVTSANISGQEVAKNSQEIKKYFDLKIDLLIESSNFSSNNIASTVIKIENNQLEILRNGEISKEDLLKL